MKKNYTVRYIDFKKASRVCKDFEDCVGSTDFDKRVIRVDSRLPQRPNSSGIMVEFHEIAHLRADDAGVKFPTQRLLEDYCDLEAICRAPKKNLSSVEVLLRQHLIGNEKYNPNNVFHQAILLDWLMPPTAKNAKHNEDMAIKLAEIEL